VLGRLRPALRAKLVVELMEDIVEEELFVGGC
jgi:hypothetical protein